MPGTNTYSSEEEEEDNTLRVTVRSKSEKAERKENSEKDRPKPKLRSAQWWRAKELGRKPHEILDGLLKQIEEDQEGRYSAYKEYERLIGSSEGPDGDISFRSIVSDELTQNELQNTLETLWSQIFKNRVVPAISVSEADYDEWDRARGLSRWLEGAFDAGKVYERVFPQAGASFVCHGTGLIRVGWQECADGKTAEIKSWSVNPRYFAVDRMEAKHGQPRSFYFKDHIDRYQLFDTYSEDREDFYGSVSDRVTGIDTAPSNDDLELGVPNTDRCDMITVREAYHLPSGPKAKDGRHVVWIKGCTLVDEEFTWDRPPLMVIRHGMQFEGFYGESPVKRLAPTQKQLDKLNKKLDECQDVMGVPRILVGDGAGPLKTQHIDDIPGSIISVSNVNQVTAWNAQCATPELYQDRDQAPRKMRSLLGISDFEAQQQIPRGMRDVSGAMLERWVDAGPSRHAMSHAQYEDGVIQLADLYILQAEECQKMGYDVVYMSPGHDKTSIEELSFKDVAVDRKKMKLRVQSMNQLPQTFAGKVDAFQKLKDAGYPVNEKTVLRMLEVPDLAGQTDMLVSDEEIIMKNLSYMCKTGEYLPPMPFDNLELIIQLTTRYINKYRVRSGSSNEKIGLLAQYIDEAVRLKRGLGGPNPSMPPGPASTMGALGMGGPSLPPGPQTLPPGAPPGLPQPMPGPMVPPVPQGVPGPF